jgi:pimeloyl-ACP methyl ester carboxylesterase
MKTKIHANEVVGTFGHPDVGGPFPAVLALGGSDGGTPDYFLNLLVPEGFAVLALPYWATPETQMTLVDVPLERIERGLRWLRDQPQAAAINGHVGIIGASRGAELALLVASTFPNLVGPVVAYTPSSVVWMGLDFSAPGRPCSTWSHNGVSLPFVPFPVDVAPARSERGISMLPLSDRGLDNQTAVERAAIAVERATGPLLLVSGGDDRVWATQRMCEMILQRMSMHARREDVVHLHYPNAGHMLFPYTPPTDVPFPPYPLDLGGTPVADAAAHASAWPKVIAQLRRIS